MVNNIAIQQEDTFQKICVLFSVRFTVSFCQCCWHRWFYFFVKTFLITFFPNVEENVTLPPLLLGKSVQYSFHFTYFTAKVNVVFLIQIFGNGNRFCVWKRIFVEIFSCNEREGTGKYTMKPNRVPKRLMSINAPSKKPTN